MQTSAASMENSMEIPQKIKNRNTLWSSYPTTGYLPNKPEINNPKRLMHPYVHRSIIHYSQDMEATQVSLDWWLDKEDVVNVYNGILLSHKKGKFVPFATTWMVLESIMLSKISQTEKDKHHMISLTCGG